MEDPKRHRVVVLGGGFGGLSAARALRKAPADVVLVDRRNHHLFQPLLYQVATGSLSPADVSAPLRHVLSRQRNASVLLAEVVDLDPEARRVVLADGELTYDTLVVATGAVPWYFGHDEWRPHAPGLKDVEDATRIRAGILGSFERAEREPEDEARRALLTFVVVGGGPTGVELAGTLAELARDTLRGDFRAIDPGAARILLVEARARLLSTYPDELAEAARASLERLGVEVWTDTRVVALEEGRVRLSRDGEELVVRAGNTLWAAGVRASPFGAVLARRAGAELDEGGRVRVTPELTLPGRPEVFVVGDLARVPDPRDPEGAPLPGVAPVAMQAGRHVGATIRRRLAGRTAEPFRYGDRGNLATIGRSAAVAELWGMRFSGLPAWLLWAVVHLFYLIGYANKVLVFVQWTVYYFTRNRSARLITETERVR